MAPGINYRGSALRSPFWRRPPFEHRPLRPVIRSFCESQHPAFRETISIRYSLEHRGVAIGCGAHSLPRDVIASGQSLYAAGWRDGVRLVTINDLRRLRDAVQAATPSLI